VDVTRPGNTGLRARTGSADLRDDDRGAIHPCGGDSDHQASSTGRRGGASTKKKYGPAFYQSIGKKGGETTKKRHGREHYEKIGKKGGQRVKQLIAQAKRAQKG
jgi:general stress protein YciG